MYFEAFVRSLVRASTPPVMLAVAFVVITGVFVVYRLNSISWRRLGFTIIYISIAGLAIEIPQMIYAAQNAGLTVPNLLAGSESITMIDMAPHILGLVSWITMIGMMVVIYALERGSYQLILDLLELLKLIGVRDAQWATRMQTLAQQRRAQQQADYLPESARKAVLRRELLELLTQQTQQNDPK